mmetsp:Transcript_30282/g.34850  ORF Transcript_30282/g.34850 Transcript_30282/m.34850 type:complete len:418 (-) Transcript_30282:371-1624(-)
MDKNEFKVEARYNSSSNSSVTNKNVSWSLPIIHIVTTRFMQGQANLIHLTRARMKLFEAICLPSMVGQELNQAHTSELEATYNGSKHNEGSEILDAPFLWIIKVDPQMEIDSLSRMIRMVKPFPNFFLIGTNDNVGRWKNDGTKHKLLNSTIYSGNVALLKQAHQYRNDKIVLETRLDADDGLHQMYLQKVQKQALKHLYIRTNDSYDRKKADWIAWCALWNLDWIPDSLTSKELQVSSFGSFIPRLNTQVCITAGLTIGMSMGVLISDVPDIQHQHLLTKGRNIGCGLNSKKKCVKSISNPKLSSLRARTTTSAGMKGIKVDATRKNASIEDLNTDFHKRKVEEDAWNLDLLDNFHLKRDIMEKVNVYFREPSVVKNIAMENLRGQCTQGHSCKVSSKEKLQRIIDLVGKIETTKI